MDAIASKAGTSKTRACTPVTMNDVLVAAIFFGTFACLTLLLIFRMA